LIGVIKEKKLGVSVIMNPVMLYLDVGVGSMLYQMKSIHSNGSQLIMPHFTDLEWATICIDLKHAMTTEAYQAAPGVEILNASVGLNNSKDMAFEDLVGSTYRQQSYGNVMYLYKIFGQTAPRWIEDRYNVDEWKHKIKSA
jgi:hypothetical protein